MPDKPNGKMNFRDRCFIEDGVKVGLSAREMAEHLGVAKSTVCNELKRNVSATVKTTNFAIAH